MLENCQNSEESELCQWFEIDVMFVRVSSSYIDRTQYNFCRFFKGFCEKLSNYLNLQYIYIYIYIYIHTYIYLFIYYLDLIVLRISDSEFDKIYN